MVPVVTNLVENAPALEGWKITAFRPRMGAGTAINFAGQLLNADNVKFTYEVISEGTKLDICLFVPVYIEEMKGALYLLLDGVLGNMML